MSRHIALCHYRFKVDEVVHDNADQIDFHWELRYILDYLGYRSPAWEWIKQRTNMLDSFNELFWCGQSGLAKSRRHYDRVQDPKSAARAPLEFQATTRWFIGLLVRTIAFQKNDPTRKKKAYDLLTALIEWAFETREPLALTIPLEQQVTLVVGHADKAQGVRVSGIDNILDKVEKNWGSVSCVLSTPMSPLVADLMIHMTHQHLRRVPTIFSIFEVLPSLVAMLATLVDAATAAHHKLDTMTATPWTLMPRLASSPARCDGQPTKYRRLDGLSRQVLMVNAIRQGSAPSPAAFVRSHRGSKEFGNIGVTTAVTYEKQVCLHYNENFRCDLKGQNRLHFYSDGKKVSGQSNQVSICYAPRLEYGGLAPLMDNAAFMHAQAKGAGLEIIANITFNSLRDGATLQAMGIDLQRPASTQHPEDHEAHVFHQDQLATKIADLVSLVAYERAWRMTQHTVAYPGRFSLLTGGGPEHLEESRTRILGDWKGILVCEEKGLEDPAMMAHLRRINFINAPCVRITFAMLDAAEDDKPIEEEAIKYIEDKDLGLGDTRAVENANHKLETLQSNRQSNNVTTRFRRQYSLVTSQVIQERDVECVMPNIADNLEGTQQAKEAMMVANSFFHAQPNQLNTSYSELMLKNRDWASHTPETECVGTAAFAWMMYLVQQGLLGDVRVADGWFSTFLPKGQIVHQRSTDSDFLNLGHKTYASMMLPVERFDHGCDDEDFVFALKDPKECDGDETFTLEHARDLDDWKVVPTRIISPSGMFDNNLDHVCPLGINWLQVAPDEDLLEYGLINAIQLTLTQYKELMDHLGISRQNLRTKKDHIEKLIKNVLPPMADDDFNKMVAGLQEASTSHIDLTQVDEEVLDGMDKEEFKDLQSALRKQRGDAAESKKRKTDSKEGDETETTEDEAEAPPPSREPILQERQPTPPTSSPPEPPDRDEQGPTDRDAHERRERRGKTPASLKDLVPIAPNVSIVFDTITANRFVGSYPHDRSDEFPKGFRKPTCSRSFNNRGINEALIQVLNFLWGKHACACPGAPRPIHTTRGNIDGDLLKSLRSMVKDH